MSFIRVEWWCEIAERVPGFFPFACVLCYLRNELGEWVCFCVTTFPLALWCLAWVLEGGLGSGAVEQAPDAVRVGVMELGGEHFLREALVANGSGEAEDGGGADGGKFGVGSGRVGPAVMHGGADFDSGRVAVEDEAAGFFGEDI